MSPEPLPAPESAYRDPARPPCPDPVVGEGRAGAFIPGRWPQGPCSLSFDAFGTRVEITAYGPEGACRDAFGRAEEDCRAYERRLSTRLPHSDVARLNAAGGSPVAVHPDTAELIRAAKGYCSLSGGVFGVTVQPAVRLWDFERGRVPAAADLAEAAAHIGWRGLHATGSGDRWAAWLDDPLAQVDLGGIAKGWIADRLAQALSESERGISGFSVNLGGNVAVGGSKPDGEPWKVGVRDPSDPGQLIATVAVARGAVVTSGTYERRFFKGGRFYHHVLDPKTGMPVDTDLASATVVARTALDAEGFSTALLALGMEGALRLARSEGAIEQAVLVGADGDVEVASG